MTTLSARSTTPDFQAKQKPLERKGSDFRSGLIASFGLLLCLLMLSTTAASAQTFKDIFEFDGTTHGCCPQYPAIMAQAEDGNLYGTTPTGGASNVGVVFKITPAGAETVLYNFDITHGSNPNGGLMLASDGNLYGTTQHGGAHAYGNIFKITTAGVLTVLYDFTGNSDGGYPLAPLMQGTDSNLYGSTYPGYAFKISTKGVFKVINKIPSVPYGPFVQGTDGAFYGMTAEGGTAGVGTIFKISGTKVTTLYNFDTTHGAFPYSGLALGADGNFYGTASAGGTGNGGVAFKVTSAGVETVLYNFDSVHTTNGYEPNAGLVAATDGNLYGATVFGGSKFDGVLYKMTTAGAITVLSNFDNTHGSAPYSTPMQHTSGVFFGLTNKGGTPGKGIVYSLNNSVVPFVALTSTLGTVGKAVGILGSGLSGTTSVKFNGATASFTKVSDTYITAKVPSGETGIVTVTTAAGTLSSSQQYRVTPKITSFTPTSGPVGAQVVIIGTGLIQASALTAGGVKVTAFTVNSDKQITLTIPTGAKTGKFVVTSPGGKGTSSGTFTVN